jgi:hypothetical protein
LSTDNTSRVVSPESERIPISNGDWLLVKKRLNAGEQQDGFERAYLKNADGTYVVSADGRRVVSPAATRMSLVTCYLVDWSLLGLDGKPLDIRGQSIATVEAILRALDTDSFKEIHEAIDNHDTEQAKARAAQKKILSGASESKGISESPSGQAGDTNGSASSTATSTTSS